MYFAFLNFVKSQKCQRKINFTCYCQHDSFCPIYRNFSKTVFWCKKPNFCLFLLVFLLHRYFMVLEILKTKKSKKKNNNFEHFFAKVLPKQEIRLTIVTIFCFLLLEGWFLFNNCCFCYGTGFLCSKKENANKKLRKNNNFWTKSTKMKKVSCQVVAILSFLPFWAAQWYFWMFLCGYAHILKKKCQGNFQTSFFLNFFFGKIATFDRHLLRLPDFVHISVIFLSLRIASFVFNLFII